jgi:hypothetical protein
MESVNFYSHVHSDIIFLAPSNAVTSISVTRALEVEGMRLCREVIVTSVGIQWRVTD